MSDKLSAIFDRAAASDAATSTGKNTGRPRATTMGTGNPTVKDVDLAAIFERARTSTSTAISSRTSTSRNELDYLAYIEDRIGDFVGHSILVKDDFLVWYPAGYCDKHGEPVFKPARMRRVAGAWRWDGGRWVWHPAGKKGGTGNDWVKRVDDGYQPPTELEHRLWNEYLQECRRQDALADANREQE